MYYYCTVLRVSLRTGVFFKSGHPGHRPDVATSWDSQHKQVSLLLTGDKKDLKTVAASLSLLRVL